MARLLALLGLRPDDGPTVAPSLAFAFLGVGAMSLATIASDTLFVSTFELGQISRFYVVTAAVRFLSAGVYAALARRLSSARLDVALLVATAASLVLAGVLSHGSSRPALYAVCMSLAVLPPLLPLVTFKAVASSLEARTARRLLPLVAAAATVGIVAVNASVPLLAGALGTPGLLYVGGLLAAMAVPLPWMLWARSAAPATGEANAHAARADVRGAGSPFGALRPEPRGDDPTGVLGALASAGRDLRAAPVVAVVLAATLLAAASANFVDYGFKATLKARYARDEMAAFLGTFGAASNLAVLLVQLFGTSRFLARFGVRASLAAPFGALAVLGACVGLAPGVVSTAAGKLVETTVHYALSAPVADLLLTPVPPRAAIRGKVLAKGLAAPLGAMLSGVVLAAFGAGGPPLWGLGLILIAIGALGLLATYGTTRAYTIALSRALGEGRIDADLPAGSAAALRLEIARMLDDCIAQGDSAGAIRTLALFDDALFCVDDLAPAFRASDPPIRRAAIAAFLRTARVGIVKGAAATDPRQMLSPDAPELPPLPDKGRQLLALAPPDDDDETERTLLAAARSLGVAAERSRLDRALDRTRAATTAAAADLWAEALVGLAAIDRRAALDALRRESLVPGSPRRAAALRALGELRDRGAQREALLSLGSADSAVFAEAARTAVLIEAHGAVAALLGRLSTGSEVRAVTGALALAGPKAIDEIIAALPTTRGQGAPVSTSIASGRSLTGSVRAARVLAKLGPAACARVLSRFPDLGYRARNAVARSLAAVSRWTGDSVDAALILDAMELTLSYAESLVPIYPRAPEGLLRREVRHRIQETAARMLDLAAVIGDRELITRARAALARSDDGWARARGHALELLENVLPRPFAARTVALLEMEWTSNPPPSEPDPRGSGVRLRSPLPMLDGWLEKCRAFDADELASTNAMVSVLEKVVVLVDASLFTGLSGEELYPVAEIAQALDFAAGEVVVRQGDPGDAVYVVASGVFQVVRDDTKLCELGPGAAFGELSLLDGAPRAATVGAVSEGRLLRIPRAEFEALLDESPELARGVIRTLIGHLRASAT